MDDHGFVGCCAGLQVQAERLLLPGGGFRLAAVIQTGFTDRDDFRVIELAQSRVQRRGRARLHVERMHADRAIDVAITLSQGFDISSIIGTHADAQKVPDPACARCVECGIQRAVMGGEVEAIKVTMGIYEHKKTATYIV